MVEFAIHVEGQEGSPVAKKKKASRSKIGDKIRKIVASKKVIEWKLRPEILCCQKIPKPLHGVVPRLLLGQKWWDKTRETAYRSTDYHCIACGVHKYDAKGRQWLEGHEVYEIDYLAGIAEYKETVPLCHFCHNYIHDGRLKNLLESGKVHHAKYVAVIQHGDAVLKTHGLTRERYEGPMAEWGDWRLVVEGKEHPPLHRSMSEYIIAMENFDGSSEEE